MTIRSNEDDGALRSPLLSSSNQRQFRSYTNYNQPSPIGYGTSFPPSTSPPFSHDTLSPGSQLPTPSPSRFSSIRRSSRQASLLVSPCTEFALNSSTTELHLNSNNVSRLQVPITHGYKYNQSLQDPYVGTTDGDEDELSVLAPYYDLTPSRLRTAFDEAIQSTQEETRDSITYGEFRVALESVGIRCGDPTAFQELINIIDPNGTQQITYLQFDSVVHRLKLTNILSSSADGQLPQLRIGYDPMSGNTSAINVSDYSGLKLRRFKVHEAQAPAFFTSVRPKWVKVRWIHLHGSDMTNMTRLAIKYRLHPLAVEDAMQMHDRAKFDQYENHFCVVFPVVRLETSVIDVKGKKTNVDSLRSPNNRKISECRHYPHSSADSEGINPCGTSTVTELIVSHVALFIVDNHTVITVMDDPMSGVCNELYRHLGNRYSKLRHNNGKFLMYTILDVVIDNYMTVVDIMTAQLVELENHLEVDKHRFDVRRMRFLKNELFRLPRLLKPSRDILKQMIEGKEFGEDVTAYLRDIEHHATQILDDLDLQLQMCRLLMEDYREAKANKMNYVIYTLTIITTVFLPAQFLTGVYGMNFDVMPELHYRYGYLLFWVLVICIGCILQFYFRYRRWV